MKRNHHSGAGQSILAMCLIAACASAFGTSATMNYQAKLTNSVGAPITGSSNLTFTFWDASSGGSQLGDGFSDLDVVTPSSSGVVSTQIGDDPGTGIPSSVFASDSVWLNVNVNGTDIVPRERISSVGYAINALPLYGKSHIIPDVTSDATANGLNLQAAIARANTLTPNGQPLSATNRVVVLVAPGQYDLGTTAILLNTEFVDLVGLSSSRDDQHIYGTSNGPGTGVLHQTANDVHLENLFVECTRSSGTYDFDLTAPTAYFPDGGYPATVVRNCHFLGNDVNAESTRLGTVYSGTYSDCDGGADLFGGSGGIASGTFFNCHGADYAFGGFFGIASGTFTNCTGNSLAFGGDNGTASGTFINCSASHRSFGGFGGTASGNFINCSADDAGAFGGDGGVATSGRFHGCSGIVGCFTSQGIPTPLFTDCSLNGKPFLSSTPSQVTAPATDDAAYNGAILLLAYSYAAALQPNGQPPSATNRATLIIPPGNYDLGSNQLTLYAPFVDVIGQTTSRNSQYIFGTADAPSSGVVCQLVEDVRIENLLVECTRTSGGVQFDANDPAAYYPDGGSTSTVVRNCEFRADDSNAWTMRYETDYNGTYIDCTAIGQSFGAGHNAIAGGTFTNCIGGNFSFGGFNPGIASGVFTNCTGGYGAFGGGGTASGMFTNCTGGDVAFGGENKATGIFTNCTARFNSFGGGGGAAGGKFTYCNGGIGSFTINGSPTVLYCVKNGVAYP